MKNFIIIFLCFIFLNCSGGSHGNAGSSGFLALTFEEHDEFNPDAAPGIIDNFKITISGKGISPIVRYFTSDTQQAQFDGFPAGSVIQITVEAINQNGFVIRRGYSESVTIQSNQTSQATVEIFNVPIFTNVKPSGYINVDRFVPKVFAPGGIQFELSDIVGDVSTSLSDVLSGDITLSISDDVYPDSTMPVYIGSLSSGEQTLHVEDPDTLEATDVQVIGYQSPSRKVMTTTAGDYLGIMARPGAQGSNLEYYFQSITGL